MTRHGMAEQIEIASIRIDQAEQQTQRRGLACAVGAEQTVAFAFVERDVDAIYHRLPSVGFVQVLRGEDDAHSCCPLKSCSTSCLIWCSRPWKKCPASGSTMMGKCCGRAQSMVSASGITSSCSPWISRVLCGTCGMAKRPTAGATSTS